MLEGLGAEATVLIMSMIPVVELRGAIPVGMAPRTQYIPLHNLELHRQHDSSTIYTLWHSPRL